MRTVKTTTTTAKTYPNASLQFAKGSASSPDSILPTLELGDSDINEIFERDVYKKVIDTEAFQRLKEIRFLGAIDYVLDPHIGPTRIKHTRFQHSLRVAQLALLFAKLTDLAPRDEAHLVIAALLHDIGHAPLSHSLEPTFKERFELTHHIASVKIITGEVPLGKELPPLFRSYNIRTSDVIALADGKSDHAYGVAFSNPINIDTIEAILRSYTYLNAAQSAITPARVLAALVTKGEDDIRILDAFWEMKDLVYNHLINSQEGIQADFVCRDYMTRSPNLWKGVYYHTETLLRSKHPELFDNLRNIKMAIRRPSFAPTVEIRYQRRRFIVDRSVRVRSYDDMRHRYKQTRELSTKRVSAPWQK